MIPSLAIAITAGIALQLPLVLLAMPAIISLAFRRYSRFGAIRVPRKALPSAAGHSGIRTARIDLLDLIGPH